MDTSDGDNRKRNDANAAEMAQESEEENMSCIVRGAHACILRISNFLGLAPLKFESRRDGYTVTITKTKCAYSYVFLIILVIATALGLLPGIKTGNFRTVHMAFRVSKVLGVSHVLILIITACAGVCSGPRLMRDMFKYMKIVAMVDNNLGAHYSDRKLYAVILVIMVLGPSVLINDVAEHILHAQSVGRTYDVIVNRLGFYLLILVVMIMELQFAITALYVCSRFQAINETLSLIVKDNALPVTGAPKLIKPIYESVRRLINMHGSLCDVVHLINKSYGMLIMLMLSSIFLHLIIKPTYLVMQITTSNYTIHFLVLQSLWCIFYLVRLCVIVEPCHYTAIEKKRTEELICHLMTSVPSTCMLPSRLQLFSRQLMLLTVTYSPMGMCTLDRPLVVSNGAFTCRRQERFLDLTATKRYTYTPALAFPVSQVTWTPRHTQWQVMVLSAVITYLVVLVQLLA